ncbi:MAG: hypothetical protein AAF696_19965 [Bacteroidota bacterium]
MRPKLKIGPLTQLQDARSSAAVGFDILSFSLERGSMKKLAPNTIWNIVNWLQGPEILLELNKDSLEELEEMNKSFQADWVSFPLEDWDSSFLGKMPGKVLLLVKEGVESESLLALQEMGKDAGKEIFFEIELATQAGAQTYQSLLSHCFFHFSESAEAFHFLKEENSAPYGIAQGEEFREDAEYLDYELIDDWMEAFEEVYPQD